jgi:hypothetical protein
MPSSAHGFPRKWQMTSSFKFVSTVNTPLWNDETIKDDLHCQFIGLFQPAILFVLRPI